MESKDKLCLYRGVLFGQSGNTLANRFKLIRVISNNDVNNLYAGVRIDHLSEEDFLNGNVIRCDWGNSLVFVPDRGIESVFLRKEDGYYDVFDADTPCVLIDNTVTEVEYGCCNLRNMNYECVVESVRVKCKKKDGRN